MTDRSPKIDGLPPHPGPDAPLLRALEILGAHPGRRLGLSFRQLDEGELRTWLLASPWFDGRLSEQAALEAWSVLARVAPEDDEKRFDSSVGGLQALGIPSSEKRAALHVRLLRGLRSLDRGLAETLRGAEDLASLGAALLPLAPGFGTAALLRFLRPLRALLPVLDELPAEPAAVEAAADLGLLGSSGDRESFGPSLATWVADRALGPEIAVDLEAALEKLGRRACRKKRANCPLEGHGCPRATRAP